MKLVNKKTGEVATLTLSSNGEDLIIMGNDMYAHITKLSELKDYEDYEEQKSWWYIDCNGEVFRGENADKEHTEEHKSIGNYYTSSEEAEKAVEKLKAWKRLKDKGFRFERWLLGGEYGNTITFSDYFKCNDKTRADLDLLFGGEE